MKKIVKKDGKIYEVWSQDVTYRNTTWTEIGTYEEEESTPIVEDETTDNEEKTVYRRKKKTK